MMRKLSSFVAKNFRSGRSNGFPQSRRDFSSSAPLYPMDGSLFVSLGLVSAVTGVSVYMVDEVVRHVIVCFKLAKMGKENESIRAVYMEKSDEYQKLKKEISGTE